MSTSVEPRDVARFRELVTRRFGLQVDDSRMGPLGETLRRRTEQSDESCAAFLDRLERLDRSERLDECPAGPDLRAIVADVTVAETYFFRHVDQLHAFRDIALPDRLRARSDAKQLRILSAGCASGEEPYSLAILIREAQLDPSWNVSIQGFDVNPEVLERAARGRFSPWSLRETPPDVRARWFRADGADLVLDDTLRAAVQFEEHNLTRSATWHNARYDVIFWRNVMMYFTPEAQREAVAGVTRALLPGGYLFLGHAETLRGITNDFHLRHTHDTFYYQRKSSAERPLPATRTGTALPAPPLAAVLEDAESWVDTIQKASRRIQALSEGSAADAAPVPDRAAASGLGSPALRDALDLLQKERFADALKLVRALPSEAARDPHVLLLRAALLTHGGDLASAEAACHDLLAVDELDAGAHYLLALCREGAGDRSAAAEHDQAAVYLDPGFAMPRLHLGLLARRTNDRDAARRDLGQALILLQREDASRLLLFGGGFGREALVALCRGELIACGGKA